jgi:soluble lytic murein transglycosylase
LFAAGAADEAAAEIASARRGLGDGPAARAALGRVYLAGGMTREAIREAESILDGLPRRPDPSILPAAFGEILYPRPYGPEIEAAARRWEIDPALVLAVIREESRFQVSAVSRAGAKGLMQIMPGTGREIARRLGETFAPADLDRPERNIEYGVHYLRERLRQFGRLDLALAAYNAGPGNTERWRRMYGHLEGPAFAERIDFTETRNYVKRVQGSYWAYRRSAERPPA